MTRIATPGTDAGLAEIAGPMTGNQLERFARAHRTVTHADDAATHVRRRLAWRFDEDGSLAATIRLPPLQGAVLLQALRAAADDVDHPHDPDGMCCGVPAGTPQRDPQARSSASLADALLVIAESFLADKIAAADNPDLYQVIIHAGPEALTAPEAAGDPSPAREPRVSAETRGSPPQSPGHPADPQRCHVEDGPAISVTTAQMIACTATLSWMLHDHDGTLLDVGRRRRRPAPRATSGTIADWHDADITPETTIPAWYGERFNLDYAIATCFANAEYHEKARHRGEREEAGGREHQAQAA